MGELPHNYFIWHPRLHEDGSVVLNLMPGEESCTPPATKLFSEELSRLLLGDSIVEKFEVVEYRSTYQADLEFDDLEDRWPINWRIRITSKPRLKELPRFRHEYIGTMAFDPAGLDLPEPSNTKCLVIADFRTARDADRCRSHISSSVSLRNMQQSLQASPPDFERVVIGQVAIQEQIDIGTYDNNFYRSGAKYAVAVAELCEKCDGITNNEERTIARDEYFDPDGIE